MPQTTKIKSGFNRYIPSLLITISFLSCNKKPEENQKLKVPETLNIQKNSQRIRSILDLFELDKIVELKTEQTNLVGKVNRLKITQNNIFIFDNVRNTIFRFDGDGKFLNHIGKKGSGPKEFIHAIDFWVDENKQEIIILDNTKKILHFTWIYGCSLYLFPQKICRPFPFSEGRGFLNKCLAGEP